MDCFLIRLLAPFVIMARLSSCLSISSSCCLVLSVFLSVRWFPLLSCLVCPLVYRLPFLSCLVLSGLSSCLTVGLPLYHVLCVWTVFLSDCWLTSLSCLVLSGLSSCLTVGLPPYHVLSVWTVFLSDCRLTSLSCLVLSGLSSCLTDGFPLHHVLSCLDCLPV